MVYRFQFRTSAGVTVRQFRTNDLEFALRTYDRDCTAHGEMLRVDKRISSSPMHPFVRGVK